MFDASYFKTSFSEQLNSGDAKVIVEIHLTNAHTHRVRAVLAAEPGYVTFDAFRQRVDGGRSDQFWGAEATTASTGANDASGEMVRVIVAYDAIAEIVITPAADSSVSRIGFARG